MREIDLVDPSINVGRLIGCDFSQELHRPANIPNAEGEAEFKSGSSAGCTMPSSTTIPMINVIPGTYPSER